MLRHGFRFMNLSLVLPGEPVTSNAWVGKCVAGLLELGAPGDPNKRAASIMRTWMRKGRKGGGGREKKKRVLP